MTTIESRWDMEHEEVSLLAILNTNSVCLKIIDAILSVFSPRASTSMDINAN